MPAAPDPELSVVLPTLGSDPALPQVLAALAAQRKPPRFELIIGLDRESGPGIARHVEALLDETNLEGKLVRGRIAGAAANRNAAVAVARGPTVLFIDDDTIPAPELLAEHARWHRIHPEPGVSVLGRVRWSPELPRTPFRAWLDRGMQFDHGRIQGIEAGWGRYYTANASSKLELIEATGGFDEVNLPYLYEDLDFAYRAREHGLRLLHNRAALVDHLRPATPASWGRRIPALARAERRFTELHPDVEPWFRRIFARAADQPRASGRGRHLARWVAPDLPWLGPRVWTSTDLYFCQLFAEEFLREWEVA